MSAGGRTTPAPRPRAPVGLLFLGWFVVAAILTVRGTLAALNPPGPQAVIAGLTALLLAAGAFWPGFRSWRAGINLRQLVALHITRLVGIWFLVLAGRGALPSSWAVPAGWGDIAVATLALGIVLLVPDLTARRGVVLAWNLLGLADLLFVIGSASRLAFADPDALRGLFAFPTGLIPVFLVPLLLASHVWLFARLRVEKV